MEDFDVSAWLGLLSQTTRFITLDTVVADGLIVERFEGHEAVNDDFRFALDCVSASAFIDLKPLLGQPLSVGIATADGSRRYWHGIVTHAASLGADGGLARYRLDMQSGLALLALRRNALIFQDRSALDVVTQVLADYPQLQVRTEVTTPLRTRPICTQYRETDLAFIQRLLGEEGLSYRFEHDQGAADGDSPGHTLVIFDTQAALPDGEPGSIRFHRIDATEQDDAISVFSERRQLVPDRVSTASWKADQVLSVAGSAQAPHDGNAPELPSLDVFDADRAGRFDTAAQAQHYASHRLDALRLDARTFHGQGAVRTLEAGKRYVLTQHPDLSGQTASTGSGQAFVPLTLEHVATNNLGTNLPQLRGIKTDDATLGKGSYRQQFAAVPADTPIAPAHRNRPLAPGVQSAIVVGVPGDALTGTRDHQVRVQFPWQRGTAPLPGGLTDTMSAHLPQGHAPGDHHAGTWVRVAEANAGAHHGHSFVPRIGNEVLVEYAHADIDQPVVVGQLYNGPATPPFAAGENSGANHPGTLSGMQTQTLDGQNGSRWVLDDASGQLRHCLNHNVADSQLNLGYLIDQNGNQRGDYRGEGFELITAGWAVVRAGEGLLLSSTPRSQGQSTQMDAAEAIGQLKAANATAQRLDSAATQAKATPLAANSAQTDLQQVIDPQQDGKYTGNVNGQASTKPSGTQRSGGDPVERFAQPAVLMEAPESLALTTPNSAASFAGHLRSRVAGYPCVSRLERTARTARLQTEAFMKPYLLAGALVFCMASTAYAQQASSDARAADQTPTPHANPRETYVAGKCSFTMRLNGGSLSIDNQSYIKGAGYSAPGTEEWSFPMRCNAGASQSDVYDQIGAKPVDGKWIDLDFNNPFKPKQKFKLIKFAGKNWRGIGTAVDQIYYADADRRSRFFNFCLIENNGPQVLCGRTQIRGITQPPSASKLPKMMAVLKTIEFVKPPSYGPLTTQASHAASALGPMHTDGHCRFRLDESPGQKYGDGAYWFLVDLSSKPAGKNDEHELKYIGMACRAGLSEAGIHRVLNLKQVDGHWVDTYTGRSFANEGAEFHELSGPGWAGQVAIYDRQPGLHRWNELHYCLKQATGLQVLCGSAVLGRSGDDASIVTNQAKVMAVLKTIEFVDVPDGTR